MEIKNLPKVFREKKVCSQPRIKISGFTAFSSQTDFSLFPENFVLYIFILDIFKNVHFQKVGLFYFWENEK